MNKCYLIIVLLSSMELLNPLTIDFLQLSSFAKTNHLTQKTHFNTKHFLLPLFSISSTSFANLTSPRDYLGVSHWKTWIGRTCIHIHTFFIWNASISHNEHKCKRYLKYSYIFHQPLNIVSSNTTLDHQQLLSWQT